MKHNVWLLKVEATHTHQWYLKLGSKPPSWMVIELETVDSSDSIGLLIDSPLGLGMSWVPTDPIPLEMMGNSGLLLAHDGSGDPKGQDSHC